ncbi:helix-turn-helix domain-containing protein [Enterococcus innesii]|uniref:helix-turn-helix domain-containing protein n=1 Tax=Enterococcus innesii TaxID=2839759 RepID=UPI003D7A845A
MKDYYTVEEVAEKLGVTTRTIRNYQKTNQLKGTKIGGQWRFSYKDVASLMGEPFEDPLLSFASIRSEKQIPESLLAIDFFIESEELLQQQKKIVIDEFNALYLGESRRFYFEKINPTMARFTLIGPLKYVTTFGQWIETILSLPK